MHHSLLSMWVVFSSSPRKPGANCLVGKSLKAESGRIFHAFARIAHHKGKRIVQGDLVIPHAHLDEASIPALAFPHWATSHSSCRESAAAPHTAQRPGLPSLPLTAHANRDPKPPRPRWTYNRQHKIPVLRTNIFLPSSATKATVSPVIVGIVIRHVRVCCPEKAVC